MTVEPATDRAPTPPTASPSSRHRCCERCQQWVIPDAPHWAWRVFEAAFWLSLPFMLFVLKGFGVVVVPFVLLFAGGLAGPLHAKADQPALCPECGAAMPRARRFFAT